MRAHPTDVRDAAARRQANCARHVVSPHRGFQTPRPAVERQFEIIGEALNQLAKTAPTLAERIPDLRRMVDFRNVLAHAYAIVDDALVWQAVQHNLPVLA